MGVTVVKRLPDLSKQLDSDSLQHCMKRIADYLVSSAQRKINSNIAPENAPLTQVVKQGNKTLRDTGALLSSINAHNGINWASAGTNLGYARIIQDGGTISGKGKGLWIPANANVRTLMRRYNAQRASELIPSMKQDGYRIWRHGGVCWAKKDKGKEIVLFIIKKSVEIPARPFLYLDKKDQNFIDKVVKESVSKALGGQK